MFNLKLQSTMYKQTSSTEVVSYLLFKQQINKQLRTFKPKTRVVSYYFAWHLIEIDPNKSRWVDHSAPHELGCLLASEVKSLHKQQKTCYGKPIEGALEASSGEVRVDRTEKTRQNDRYRARTR